MVEWLRSCSSNFGDHTRGNGTVLGANGSHWGATWPPNVYTKFTAGWLMAGRLPGVPRLSLLMILFSAR